MDVQRFVANFESRLREFCQRSSRFGKQSQNAHAEKQRDLLAKYGRIWVRDVVERTAQAPVPRGPVIPFRYTYTILRFNEDAFEEYRRSLNEFNLFFFGNAADPSEENSFLPTYLQEQLSLHKLLYSLLEFRSRLRVQDAMTMVSCVLRVMQDGSLPKYTVAILKEFVHFLAYAAAERRKRARLEKEKKEKKKIADEPEEEGEIADADADVSKEDAVEKSILDGLMEKVGGGEAETEGEGEVVPKKKEEDSKPKHDDAIFATSSPTSAEDDGGSSARQILQTLILGSDAGDDVLDVLIPLYTPSVTDMLVSFEEELRMIHASLMGPPVSRSALRAYVSLLRKFPLLQLRSSGAPDHEVDKFVLQPIGRVIVKQSQYKTHPELVVQAFRMITAIVRSYPAELMLEGMSVMTRDSPWPGRFVSSVFLAHFPFESLEADDPRRLEVFDWVFRETYNLFGRSYQSLGADKMKHQDSFLGLSVLPWVNIVAEIHAAHPDIAALNENCAFPFVRVLVRILSHLRASDKKSEELFRDILEVLLSLAFKSGTTKNEHLPLLAKLRTESIKGIVKAFKHNREPSFRSLVQLLIGTFFPFLKRTQGAFVPKVIEILSRLPYDRWVLREEDIFVMQAMMQSDAYLDDFKAAVMRKVDWSIQDCSLGLNLAAAVVESGLIKAKGNVLSGFTVRADDEKKVLAFLSTIRGRTGDEYASLRVFLSLVLRERVVRSGNLTGAREDIVAARKILQSAPSIPLFGGAILSKIVWIAARLENPFEFVDLVRYVVRGSAAGEVSLTFDPADEFYAKCLSVCSFAFVADDSGRAKLLLDDMIKRECRAHRSLTPVLESLIAIGRTSQRGVLNLIATGFVWLAYAHVLAFGTRLPPVRGSGDVQALDTATEASLWIAMECGQTLVEKKEFLSSLMFWEQFFSLYFEACGKHTARAFPPYLRQRINKFFATAAQSAGEEDLALLFGSFGSWNPGGIIGGVKFSEPYWERIFGKEPVKKSEKGKGKDKGKGKGKGKDQTSSSDDGECPKWNGLEYLGHGQAAEEKKPFYREVTRYNQLRKQLDDSFASTSILEIISADQQKLFSEELLSLFDQYQAAAKSYQENLDEHLAMTPALYKTVDQSERAKLANPRGGEILAEFPTKRTVIATPNAEEIVKKSKEAFKKAQETFLDLLETLAFLQAALEKVTDEMMDYEQFQSVALSFYFTMLPPLLNLRKAMSIAILYRQTVKFVSVFGRELVSKQVKLQENLLSVFTTALREEEPLYETDVLKELKRIRLDLFGSGFDPEVLYKHDVESEHAEYLAFLDRSVSLAEGLGPRHTVELQSLFRMFTFDSLFAWLATKPAGARFKKIPEIRSLVGILQRVLCDPVLDEVIGERLLQKCLEIAFPLEISPFLRLLLSLSKTKKYGGRWDKMMDMGKRLLSEVTPEVALQWIQIVHTYQPLENEKNGISALLFVKMIMMETQLFGVLSRSDLDSEEVTSVVDVFKAHLSSTKEVSVDAFSASLEAFKDLVSSFPFFIDLTWDFYYALSKSIISRKASGDASEAVILQQQLSNIVQQLGWEKASFHESKAAIVLDNMNELFPHDPVAIGCTYGRLNWDFLNRSHDSGVLSRFLRVYFDLNIYDSASIPDVIKKLVDDHEADVDDPLWMRIKAQDLAGLYAEQSVCRLVHSIIVKSDPARSIWWNLTWILRTSMKLSDGEPLANVVAREIDSLLLLHIRSQTNESSCWYLPLNVQSDLVAQFLVPLATKYVRNEQILQVILSSVEMVHAKRPVLVQGAVPFSLGVPCPFPHSPDEVSERFRVIVEQFISGIRNEEVCKSVLRLLPRVEMKVVTRMPLLNRLLLVFLMISRENFPRDVACQCVATPTDFPKTLDACVDGHHALSLVCLLQKSVLNVSEGRDKILPVAFTQALRYVPIEHNYKHIVYVMLFVMELIENADFAVSTVPGNLELVNRYQTTLTFLGDAADVSEAEGKKRGFFKRIGDKLRRKPPLPRGWTVEVVVPVPVSLAAKLLDLYLAKVLTSKSIVESTSGMELMSSQTSYLDAPKLARITRLAPKFGQYAEFFRDMGTIGQLGPLDFFTIKLVMTKLFPQSGWMFR